MSKKCCPYCAQTDTRKDEYGYCKKYDCFEVSGDKKKLDDLKSQLSGTILMPTYKLNQFDNTPYNPRKEERSWLLKQVETLLGFVPLNLLDYSH